MGPVELQVDAVTRSALADGAVGGAEVAAGVIGSPKLSAAVREDIADVESYARPSSPSALIPISRIDTRSIYMAGPGGLPTAAGTSGGDVLIRINSREGSVGLEPEYPHDWTYAAPVNLNDAVGVGGAVYAVAGGLRVLTATGAGGAIDLALIREGGITALDSATLLVVGRLLQPGQPQRIEVRKVTLAGASIGADVTLASSTGGIDVHGAAFLDGHLYVLERGGGAERMRAWNAVTYDRVADRDFEANPDYVSTSAVTAADNHLYVWLGTGIGVRVWTAAGVRVPGREFNDLGDVGAIADFGGRLLLIGADGARAYNYDGSRASVRGSYVDSVSATLYQSDGNNWDAVDSVRGIHGGGIGGTGITEAQARAIALVATRTIFSDALEQKLLGVESGATADQTGAEIVAAITGAIGAAWRTAGVTLTTLESAIATHDAEPLGGAHVTVIAGHNADAAAHPGVVGHRGAAVYTGPMLYDAGANQLRFSHSLQAGLLQWRDIFYGLVPTGVANVSTTSGMTLTGDGITEPITDPDGVPIAPRQLRDGRLYVFMLGSTWRLIESLSLPSPVPEYPRYGVFSGTSEVLPTAAQFLGGAVWMAQQSYGDAIVRTESEFHWVADRRDDLGIIAFGAPSAEPNTLTNSRRYRLAPVGILIGGVQYYAYRSLFPSGTGLLRGDYQVVLRPV